MDLKLKGFFINTIFIIEILTKLTIAQKYIFKIRHYLYVLKNKADILERLTSKFYPRTEEIANLQKIINISFKEQYL